MFIITTIIAGATYYWGSTTYKNYRQQKHDFVEKLPAVNHVSRKKKLSKKPTKSLFSSTRQHQMQEFGVGEISTAEQQLNRELAVSIAMLAVSILGTVAFPSLLWLLLPAFIYTVIPIIQDVHRSITKDKKLNLSILDLFFYSGMMTSGYYILAIFRWDNLLY